jgi:putative ubiquitin-RnfH superfamily antitoxin RatB of RatAB toxin-antitoxin module
VLSWYTVNTDIGNETVQKNFIGPMETQKNSEIQIEVVYASPTKQKLVTLTVRHGTTALEAVRLSNIAADFPEIEMGNLDLGIFSQPLDGKGRPLPDEYEVRDLDRVEIYRPLTIDPMQARLARAEEKRAAKEAAKKRKNEHPA